MPRTAAPRTSTGYRVFPPILLFKIPCNFQKKNLSQTVGQSEVDHQSSCCGLYDDENQGGFDLAYVGIFSSKCLTCFSQTCILISAQVDPPLRDLRQVRAGFHCSDGWNRGRGQRLRLGDRGGPGEVQEEEKTQLMMACSGLVRLTKSPWQISKFLYKKLLTVKDLTCLTIAKFLILSLLHPFISQFTFRAF